MALVSMPPRLELLKLNWPESKLVWLVPPVPVATVLVPWVPVATVVVVTTTGVVIAGPTKWPSA